MFVLAFLHEGSFCDCGFGNFVTCKVPSSYLKSHSNQVIIVVCQEIGIEAAVAAWSFGIGPQFIIL
jgi:hypothetical protein